jgi:hypothetical protein
MDVLANGFKAQFWIPVEEEPDIDRFVDEQIMIDMDRFMLVGTLEKVSTCKKKNEEKEWEYFKQITIQVNNICSADNNNVNIAIPAKKEDFLYEVKFRYAPEPEQESGDGMEPVEEVVPAHLPDSELPPEDEDEDMDEAAFAAESDAVEKAVDAAEAKDEPANENGTDPEVPDAAGPDTIPEDEFAFQDTTIHPEAEPEAGLTGAEAAELPPEENDKVVTVTPGKPLIEVLAEDPDFDDPDLDPTQEEEMELAEREEDEEIAREDKIAGNDDLDDEGINWGD